MTEKFHVIQLASGLTIDPPLGGIEQFVMGLCQSIDREKFAITACGMWNYEGHSNQSFIEAVQAAGSDVFVGPDWDAHHPYLSFWKSYIQIKKFLKGRPVDIIHSHSQFGDVMALILNIQCHAILVRTIQEQKQWRKSLLRRIFLLNMVYPMMYQAEIGVNQSIVNILENRPLARLLRRKSHSIYNATNFERFQKARVDQAAKKRELGLPASSIVIGSVGRMTEQKGYVYFLQAAKKVLEVHKADIYFLLVGSGELEDPLHNLCQQLGIEQRFIFSGSRSDIEEVMQTFDLFVSSSLWEGLPTVIMESIATGVPVVATNIPGSDHLIQDRVSGWLVPPADPGALASAILEALDDPHTAQAYSQKAVPVLQEVNIARIAAQYDTLFENLLVNNDKLQ